MEAAEQPFIDIRKVAFAYGDRPILKDINLSIPKGKLIAIMGGSGCGKTTLLRLLSGQQKPQQGEVIVNGQHVETMDTPQLYQYRKSMGMLFQFGALFTDLNVFDNIAFPLRENTNLPEEIRRGFARNSRHENFRTFWRNVSPCGTGPRHGAGS